VTAAFAASGTRAAAGLAGVVPATRFAKSATAARVGLRVVPRWFPAARVPGSRWTFRAWFMHRGVRSRRRHRCRACAALWPGLAAV